MSPDAGPGPNATTSGINNSMDRNGLTRTDTMVFTALEESQLIGRVNERSEIIQLVSNIVGQEFQVISLWGMGGLGKTILVRDIYQSQEIDPSIYSFHDIFHLPTSRARNIKDSINQADMSCC